MNIDVKSPTACWKVINYGEQGFNSGMKDELIYAK